MYRAAFSERSGGARGTHERQNTLGQRADQSGSFPALNKRHRLPYGRGSVTSFPSVSDIPSASPGAVEEPHGQADGGRKQHLRPVPANERPAVHGRRFLAGFLTQRSSETRAQPGGQPTDGAHDLFLS